MITYLTHPKWREALKESPKSFILTNFCKAGKRRRSKRCRARLHFNLQSFHRAQRNISNNFSWCRSRQVKRCPVIMSEFFSSQVGVSLLEVLIKSEFTQSLQRIPNWCREPAGEEPTRTFSLYNSRPSIEYGGVQIRVNLEDWGSISISIFFHVLLGDDIWPNLME